MDRKFALVRGDLGRLAADVDRFLGRNVAWHEWPVYLWRRPLVLEREYLAPTEVFDRDGQTVIKMEMPGVEMEDIDISLHDGILTIKGEKKHEEETEEKDYHFSERSYGHFSRTLSLPEGVDGSKLTATYESGVLEISMPKVEAEREHKVEVKARKATARTRKTKATK